MTKIINLFGCPGAGKSTLAAGLFHLMKKLDYKVELVTEYAKEKVYDNSLDVMCDQLYMLAKQNRRLERLIDKVDYIVTDSPLLLAVYYGEHYGRHFDVVGPTAIGLFNKYDNINFLIERTKEFRDYGRLGGEDSSNKAAIGIRELLEGQHCNYKLITSDTIPEAIIGLL